MKVLRFFVVGYLLFSPLFADEVIAQESSYMDDILHMTGTLVILLIFIAGALFFFKKMMRSRLNYINRSTSIKILERRALHSKASLYLIEALGKTVLISEAQGHINLLTEIDNPIHPIQEEIQNPPKINFAEFLKKKLNSKKNG